MSADVPDLANLVEVWLDWPETARLLGVTPAKVRTMVRDHELAEASRCPGRGPASPPSSSKTVSSSRALLGCSRSCTTTGTTTREAIAWIFTDAELPGRPIDALRENRGAEVKRRAQALA